MSISPIPSVLPEAFNQYPQGYYPFEESPAKIPPKVRKPPYLQTQVNCPGTHAWMAQRVMKQKTLETNLQ